MDGIAVMSGKDPKKSPKELWLEEYPKESTRKRYARDFAEFLEWAGKSDSELVYEWRKSKDKKRWAKEMGALLMRYYSWLVTEAPCYDVGYDEKRDPEGEHLHKGISVNSARTRLTAAMAFFASQCDRVKIRRGAFPRPKMALGEHEFTQEELRAIFHYGDVKEKAILATAVALGWGADDFLRLKWAEVGPLLDAEPFTGFWHERGKTGAVSRSHLTPEAIESLRTWKKVAKSDDYVFSGNDKPWTNSALSYTVGQMVKKAGIKPRGRVHFHLFRKFLIRQLSNAGLNRDHIRIIVGKQVSPDLLTYLQQNVDHLKAEYESAYQRFSLAGYANNARGRVGDLEATVAEQAKQIAMLQYIIARSIPEERTQSIVEGLVEKYGSDELKETVKVQKLRRLDPAEIIARILRWGAGENTDEDETE